MTRNPEYKARRRYWLKVFALYALAEALIQFAFLFLLNTFGENSISTPEFHLVMWAMQCLLIWPIWGVAWLVRRQRLLVQIVVNLVFYILYTRFWFGPVQDAIGFVYEQLVQLTRARPEQYPPYLDRGNEYAYINYQLLKHAYRLSWFFLAAYLYNYLQAEKQRTELAVANRELQLKLLKWRLNPSFYFKTIGHLGRLAETAPVAAAAPILQLSQVMEYVIYDAREAFAPVTKELKFLANYIELLNSRQHNGGLFRMEVQGNYEGLKIAPLLLAGIVDSIAASQPEGQPATHVLQLFFNRFAMRLQVSGPGSGQLTAAPVLLQRLAELYPGKHSVQGNHSSTTFVLTLTLHDD